MKILDLETWPRRKQYEFFRKMDYPHINVCFPFDITNLKGYCRKNNLSITHSILYISARTANSIKEFRLRIRGEEVVEHECISPSYTVLRADESFSFCTVEYTSDAKLLMARAEEEQQKVYAEMVLEDEPGRDDFLFISVLPWISFTNTTHPINMHPVDSVPRLVWGKFYADPADKQRTLLPYSIQAHHALADGVHFGKFAEIFQNLADNPATTLV
ncbi:MAG: chloramphenicol O-acetyltransferase type A [Flavobacterium sp.]|jgi:chloramphenicol O-acetyltransferase type A